MKKIELEPGEVIELPQPRTGQRPPLVGRLGTADKPGKNCIVVIPGKNGLSSFPYGQVFFDYEEGTNTPIFGEQEPDPKKEKE